VTDTPETWPPEPSPELPLFALPDVWLFPYIILPLRIFEERYKQMIDDNLDGPGRVVLGTVVDGAYDGLEGSPPIYPIAGLGEIGRHERRDDGGFNILLVGLRRVTVREVESDRLYRKVAVEPAEEVPIDRDAEFAVRNRLVAAILERTEGTTAFPPNVSVSHLTDILTLRMDLPHAARNALFSNLDEEDRARRALEEHARGAAD